MDENSYNGARNIITEKLMVFLPYAGLTIVIAAAFIIQTARIDVPALIKYVLVLILGYIAAINDIKTKKIPNSLILVMLGGWIAMSVPAILLNTEAAIESLIESAFGFASGGGLFLIVYLISHKSLGGGDVKLMACVGLYLGFSGILAVMLWGTILAALTGLVLILFRKIGHKDSIPLAPFLYIGILIAVFFV